MATALAVDAAVAASPLLQGAAQAACAGGFCQRCCAAARRAFIRAASVLYYLSERPALWRARDTKLYQQGASVKTVGMLAIVVVTLTRVTCGAILTDLVVRVAADGSAMGGASFFDDVTLENAYPLGFTMYDKKGAAVFVNAMPSGLGSDPHLHACDGRVAVFSDASTQTFVFALGPTGFTLIGTLAGWVDGDPILTKSETIVPAMLPPAVPYTLTSYSKNMRKIKWSVVLQGDYYWLDKGVFAVLDGTMVSFIKKGKSFEFFTTASAVGLNAFGARGTLATWPCTDGTNGPVTYITKKGTLATALLPGIDQVWNFCPVLNKDIFYVVVPGALNLSTVHAFKLGTSYTWLGSFAVEYFDEIELDGKNVIIHRDDMVNHGIIVTDATLGKTITSTAMQPGQISVLGKGVYCRAIPNAASVTLVIFNKKGTIATHTFSLP
jgi:hypothetical protein